MRVRTGVWLLGVAMLLAIVSAVLIAGVPGLRWRAAVIFARATGGLSDVDWPDLVWMIRPGSDTWIAPLAESGNPYVVIQNPRTSSDDIKAGAQLFRVHCVSCHGDDARGGPGGPNLHGRRFRQGRSDWALYRTIVHGVPGTAMVGAELARNDTWQLVAYLDSELVASAANAASTDSRTSGRLIDPVTPADLRAAANGSSDWLTYFGAYNGQRYSHGQQIDRSNVARLRVDWIRELTTDEVRVQTTPIVRGSTMFMTEPPNRVHALDASSGRTLWVFTHALPTNLTLCCGPVNRGVALLGDRVYVGTLDGHLIALDAHSGKLIWEVVVAESTAGQSITSAPLAVDDMIVVGIAGGEYKTRGYLSAFDAATGKERWRFYTVPAQGEPGSDTWAGESFRQGGGPTWFTGTFDPELRLIYWGIGGPNPNFYGGRREGDNLFTNSIAAIDPSTGRLRWYFQTSPHDLHDWDAVEVPVLIDASFNGSPRQLLAQANRNGFYYLLDRTNGRFLLGTPFVRQSWADGLDTQGRPKVRPDSIPTLKGSIVYPGIAGGTNWWPPAYDPTSGLMFVPTIDLGSIFFARPDEPPTKLGQNLGGAYASIPDEKMVLSVKALDALTGHVRWQYVSPRHDGRTELSGLLSTAGGLVFGGDQEIVYALDADTGAILWQFRAGGEIIAAPISYQLADRQYIAVAAGRSILTFTLAN